MLKQGAKPYAVNVLYWEPSSSAQDNDVDGETVDCGLTETMVSYLFQGSFKKQVKFNQFVCKLKEPVVMLTLEPVPPEECQQSSSAIPRYPTTSEYVQVVKMLIVKYPFLKDLEGNGYHTWHMSLRRKFKWERAPLVDNSEVRGSKEKFGHKKSKQLVETARTSQRKVSKAPSVLGEDPSSIEAHVNVLNSQYQKMQPDFRIVRDRMQQTFAWRQKEIADGMTVEDTVKKYPFFKDTHRDIDFRAALIFLPYIFKENIDRFITLGETDLDSPYPTIQLTDRDWKMAFARRAPNILKVDHIELFRNSGIDEGIISAFCTYFVFNLAYPRHLKNTLMFLQSERHLRRLLKSLGLKWRSFDRPHYEIRQAVMSELMHWSPWQGIRAMHKRVRDVRGIQPCYRNDVAVIMRELDASGLLGRCPGKKRIERCPRFIRADRGKENLLIGQMQVAFHFRESGDQGRDSFRVGTSVHNQACHDGIWHARFGQSCTHSMESCFAIDATPVELFGKGVGKTVLHNSPNTILNVNSSNDTQGWNLGWYFRMDINTTLECFYSTIL
ncbi:sterile alpha motif domain-containing 3-like isoform X1 [Labeo rohita]|uniref:Sterile alpha motif domain-containing 3-like isoform X1 n=2 Tax=Labeonini TaxID=2743697 RepID=A0A498LFC1_LABRO|nr:sterile alpha motif domain-containing 3-like isoform X1 [Labeo rohita]